MKKVNILQLKKQIKYIALSLAVVLFLGAALFVATKKMSAQTPLFFMPNFPTRIMHLAYSLDEISQESIKLNEKLKNLVEECDCEFAESLCKQTVTNGQPTACEPIKAFGKPCSLVAPGEETDITIAGITQDINSAVLDLSYFYKLLVAEKEAGLDKQIQTLREDDAQVLSDSLTNPLGTGLLDLTPKIIELVEKNLTLPEQCSVANCTAKCGSGSGSDLNFCIQAGATGKQTPTEIKFSAGISIDDWDLGKIGIKKINFNLPKKIDMPDLPNIKLPSFKISIPEITIDCPLLSQEITFQTPQPPLPKSPTIKLSCPDDYGAYPDYQCNESVPSETSYIKMEWYLKIFSYLSEKCFEVVQPEDYNDYGGANHQLLMKKCMNPETVAETIVKECDNKWKQHWLYGYWYLPGDKPEICKQIGRSPERIQQSIYWCNNLFSSQITPPETPPATCSTAPKATAGQKCDSIRDSGVEEPLLSCELLPLFPTSPFNLLENVKLENPSGETTWGGEINCPDNQKAGDYPTSPIRECSINAPSIPKIPLSKYSIIIPDLKLPSFKLLPLFSIKLPSFIFEDLIFEDIELCNLDDCKFKFPDLNFELPSLKIPQIKVPPIKLDDIPGIPDIPGNPNIEISIEPMEFGSMQFNFPQLINLNSLVSPELEMPNLNSPKPKLDFSFGGIKIDFVSLLLGLFKLPSFSACYSVTMPNIPIIDISYPDYIFSWPAFPDIPEIPFCKTAREFCRDANTSIQEIVGQAEKIQKEVNKVIDDEIQQKLKDAANQINATITDKIKDELNDPIDGIAANIKKAINAHISIWGGQTITPPPPIPMPGVYPVSPGTSCAGIPPLKIPATTFGSIDIGEIKLSDYVSLPDKIVIPWPPELEELTLLSDDLSYPLPKIPLSGLSYSKDITINLPGLQDLSLSASFNASLGNATACIADKPQIGDACGGAASDIGDNITDMENIATQLQEASQKIRDVLE